MPEQNDTTQSITLVLDCFRVALRVPRSQEPVYRAAAEMLNNTYQKYVRLFPRKSPQELWALTALEAAVNLKEDVRDKNMQPVIDQAKALNQMLTQFLEAEEK